MTDIVAEPLTAKAFARFGHVSETENLSGLLSLPYAYEGTQDAGIPVLNLVTLDGITARAEITHLETHPFSNQTFLPLDLSPSMIVVCDAATGGEPDISTIRAFVARSSQIVTYRQGVLHHRLTPIGAQGTFAMTMRQTGRRDDTVIYELAQPVTVMIPE